MGLKSSPATQLFVYLYDIVVYAKNLEDHGNKVFLDVFQKK